MIFWTSNYYQPASHNFQPIIKIQIIAKRNLLIPTESCHTHSVGTILLFALSSIPPYMMYRFWPIQVRLWPERGLGFSSPFYSSLTHLSSLGCTQRKKHDEVTETVINQIFEKKRRQGLGGGPDFCLENSNPACAAGMAPRELLVAPKEGGRARGSGWWARWLRDFWERWGSVFLPSMCVTIC